jgi:pimeloyl-ACP methyl ester carboxylesterase
MPQTGEIYYFESKPKYDRYNPVVLIHGAGGHHLHWPHQLRRLADQHVLAPDLPGHGKSGGLGQQSVEVYARAVIEWLRGLNLRQVIVVGHSMGGAIAQHLALAFPEAVRGLVLVGSGARLPVNADILDRVSRPETFPAGVDLIINWSYAEAANPRLKAQVREAMLETRSSALHNDLLACQSFDSRARLKEIEQPALVVVGAEDRMTPVRLSEELHAGLAHAELHIVPAAGHMVALEKPEDCARHVRAFIGTFSG